MEHKFEAKYKIGDRVNYLGRDWTIENISYQVKDDIVIYQIFVLEPKLEFRDATEYDLEHNYPGRDYENGFKEYKDGDKIVKTETVIDKKLKTLEIIKKYIKEITYSEYEKTPEYGINFKGFEGCNSLTKEDFNRLSYVFTDLVVDCTKGDKHD